MSSFPLLRQLNDPQLVTSESKLSSAIKYSKYEVDSVDSGTLTVHIPTSRAAMFEDVLSKHSVLLEYDIRNAARSCSGIMGD